MTLLSRFERSAARVYVAIGLVAVAAHGSALRAGWVWLDHAHLEQRLALVPLDRLWTAFTQGFAETSYYRPLMTVSLSLDAAAVAVLTAITEWAGAGAPHPSLWFHAVSLVWHAAASVMVAAAARTWALPRHAWWLAGVLFAVHPSTSVVASAIAFRSEAMMTTGLLGLIVAHTRRRAGWASMCVALASLSKETGLVMTPLVLAVLQCISPQQNKASTPHTTLWAAEGATWLTAVTLRFAYAPRWHATYPPLTWQTAIGSRLAAITESAQRILVAGDRTVCDAFAITSWSHPTAWIGAALLALWIYAAARHRRSWCVLALLATLPSLQLVAVMRWWSPHYVYLPWAFCAMGVAGFASQAYRARRAGITAALLACTVFGVVSFRDGYRFGNDLTLWRTEVDANPYCREGMFYLGEHHRIKGEYAHAERWYLRALAPEREADWERAGAQLSYLDTVATMQNLGVVQLEQQRFHDAYVAFTRALGLNRSPRRAAELTHNAALAALLDGNAAAAWQLIAPRCHDPRTRRHTLLLCAKTLYANGRFEQSLVALRRAGTTE